MTAPGTSPTSADCIFCKIIERRADALIIHEDDRTISFLALHPAVPGHTLVVPKMHYADVYSIPDDELAALSSSCKMHASRWREQVGSTGVNILNASGVDGSATVASTSWFGSEGVSPLNEMTGCQKRPGAFAGTRAALAGTM